MKRKRDEPSAAKPQRNIERSRAKRAKIAKLRKSEIRISKSETNDEAHKSQISNHPNIGGPRSELFSFWSFEFVSNFGFRASNFNLILGALGARNTRELGSKEFSHLWLI